MKIKTKEKKSIPREIRKKITCHLLFVQGRRTKKNTTHGLQPNVKYNTHKFPQAIKFLAINKNANIPLGFCNNRNKSTRTIALPHFVQQCIIVDRESKRICPMHAQACSRFSSTHNMYVLLLIIIYSANRKHKNVIYVTRNSRRLSYLCLFTSLLCDVKSIDNVF